MKKHAILFLTLLVIGANLIQFFDRAIVEAQGPVVIPDEAIRLRILANSDSDEDQSLKREIRDEVNAEITTWVGELTNIEKAREIISNRLPEIEEIIYQFLDEKGIQQSVKVEFGKVNFPTKIYGNYIYPAGQYEALLITLGDGTGANWWCVLFPPLCFLDFPEGDAKKNKEETNQIEATTEKVKVKSFVAEAVKKLKD